MTDDQDEEGWISTKRLQVDFLKEGELELALWLFTGTFGNIWRHFGCDSLVGRLLLASSGWWPGIPLNILG